MTRKYESALEEHKVLQDIEAVRVTDEVLFKVGVNGITQIEAIQKSGMYANLPYVRVWRGETAIAEFCQHGIVGIYFSDEPRLYAVRAVDEEIAF